MQQFLASPDFKRCQQEYAALLDNIVEFAQKNANELVLKLSDDAVDGIRISVNTLKDHLSDLAFLIRMWCMGMGKRCSMNWKIC